MRLLLILALLLPVPALASDWQQLDEDTTSILYIDKESINPVGGGHYRAWIKEIWKMTKETHRLHMIEFSCRGEYLWLEVHSYDSKGVDQGVQGERPWKFIRPDSDEQKAEKVVCKK